MLPIRPGKPPAPADRLPVAPRPDPAARPLTCPACHQTTTGLPWGAVYVCRGCAAVLQVGRRSTVTTVTDPAMLDAAPIRAEIAAALAAGAVPPPPPVPEHYGPDGGPEWTRTEVIEVGGAAACVTVWDRPVRWVVWPDHGHGDLVLQGWGRHAGTVLDGLEDGEPFQWSPGDPLFTFVCVEHPDLPDGLWRQLLAQGEDGSWPLVLGRQVEHHPIVSGEVVTVSVALTSLRTPSD